MAARREPPAPPVLAAALSLPSPLARRPAAARPFVAMSKVIENLERQHLRKGIPGFEPGDRVKVHFQVVEGNRRRTQVFEGTVIKRQGAGVRETFTVRKQSFGVGVERTFPVHSPKIEKIEVQAIGDVNRAKLYYLRAKVGKKARVREVQRGPAVSSPRVADDVESQEPPADEPVAEEAVGDEPAAEEPVADVEDGAEAAEVRPKARRSLRRRR